MKTRILTLILILFVYKSYAQVIKGAGVIYFDSIPNVNAAISGSELAYSIKMKKVFRWDRQNSTWVEISSDTTSLSNRINTKLNISDTTAMLSPYLKKTDTTSLSNRINTKLNISDTTAMLSPYLKKTDTTSLSNRINLKRDTADVIPILKGGTNATTAAAARTNLGLVIGTDVLAPNGSAANLTSFPTLNQSTTGTAANVTGIVAATNGGTGQNTYAIGDILYANTTTTLAKLSPSTAGRVLITNGSGQAPSWSDVGTAVTTLTTPTAISGSTTVTFNASGKPMAVFRQASSSGATTTITSVTISNPVTGGVYSIHLPTPTGPANQVQVNWNTTTPAFKDLALTNLGTRYYTTATIITCYYDGTDFICK